MHVSNDFLSGDENLSSPGCACSTYDPQPISDRQVGTGFPHRAGRFQRGGFPFPSPGFWSRRDVEGCLTGRRDPILPGCGGASTLARGQLCLRARSTRQKPTNGVAVSTPRKAVLTRGTSVFVAGLLQSSRCETISSPGMRTYYPRTRRDLDVGQREDSLRALAA